MRGEVGVVVLQGRTKTRKTEATYQEEMGSEAMG